VNWFQRHRAGHLHSEPPLWYWCQGDGGQKRDGDVSGGKLPESSLSPHCGIPALVVRGGWEELEGMVPPFRRMLTWPLTSNCTDDCTRLQLFSLLLAGLGAFYLSYLYKRERDAGCSRGLRGSVRRRILHMRTLPKRGSSRRLPWAVVAAHHHGRKRRQRQTGGAGPLEREGRSDTELVLGRGRALAPSSTTRRGERRAPRRLLARIRRLWTLGASRA